jgi:hypothetical protein
MNFKKFLPHIIAVVIFVIIGFIYYPDVFKGYVMKQHDYDTYRGMSKEIVDYREATGEEALWTNRMFGGMPAYLISVQYPNQKPLAFIHRALMLWTPRPVSFLVLSMLMAYFAFLMFGVRQWLSVVGAVAYAFSSYFLIVVEAGHITKMLALAYMPIVIASIYYAYKKNKWVGTVVFAFALALQILVNHLQITYYTMMTAGVMILFIFIDYLKQKALKEFLIRSALLVIAVVFAIGSNFPSLYLTYEYGKYSTRGKSELTFNKENKTSGLDKDYITQWSYGVDETMTLLIPDFMGGASVGELDQNSNTYNFLTKKVGYPPSQAKQVIKQMPTYWGTQPFTSGPVYVGAIIVFLFIMGFFLIKDNTRWWILLATILSIMLAWGKNFMPLTDFFIDYVPGYDKFRSVSMILVIAEFTMPLFAILTLNKILYSKLTKEEILKALKYSFIIVGGLLLFIALFAGGLFSFEALTDQAYIKQGAVDFVNALREDRKEMLVGDAWRSFIFVLLAAAGIFLYLKKTLDKKYLIIFVGALILIDLWGLDKRYVNSDDFVRETKDKVPYPLTPQIAQILQDTTLDYRVFNLTVSPFNDASTSYYVNSIGGYHGAKMKRYQELIDFCISKNNMNVLNMLNTKYFIVPTKDGQAVVQQNPNALGNVWFVQEYKLVPNADSEITALCNFNPAKTAIVDKRFEKYIRDWKYVPDPQASIKLVSYAPNKLVYEYNAKTPQFAVFSEIYYPKGWNAYVDGKLMPHFRVNYVLRAMILPAGNHKVVFKFEPKGYFVGYKVAYVFVILLFVFAGVVIYLAYKEKLVYDGQENEESTSKSDK